MNYLATITSKRQLTIPADIFRSLNLKEGEKVAFIKEEDYIKVIPALRLINKLAGSVTIPKKFKNLSLEGIIKKTKEEHFKK